MPKSVTKEDGTLDKEAVNELLDEHEKTLEPAQAKAEEEKTADAEDENASDGAAAIEGDSEDDWIAALSADLKELADSLEISEGDLREFSGPEELERHARLHDKHIMRLGRTPPEEPDEEPKEEPAPKARGKDGRFQKAEDVYEPGLSQDEYDPAIVGEFKKVADHFGDRIGRLEKMLKASEERVASAERQQRDAIIDTLGHEDLFGAVDKPRSAAQETNRQKLLDSFDVLRAGLVALGKRSNSTPALMRRAFNSEFAEYLSTKHRKSLTKALQKQSSNRLGGGKSQSASLHSKAWTGDPEEDPALIEAYWNAVKESGGR